MKKYLLCTIAVVTICGLNVFSQPVTLIDANFETTYGPLTYSSFGINVWQVGTPSKPFFGTASSPPNAVMTDSINPYPVNVVSSIILRNIDTLNVHIHNFTALSFDHKFQTTAGMDGGAIEVSYDGMNWQNVLTDTFFQNRSQFLQPTLSNMYDTTDVLYNGAYGFNGNSGGWVHTEIDWGWYFVMRINSASTFGGTPVQLPDSMFIRFTFYSDSNSESLDGWMIDNIKLIGDDGGGIEENNLQLSEINLFPQPASEAIQISINHEIHPASYCIYDLNGRKIKSGVANNQFCIDVSDLSSGMYQLATWTRENELLNRPMSVSH
jgi:hypothetical protein